MSLVDQVRSLPQQVIERLKELEPLAREYEQLRKFAERLGLKYSPAEEPEAEPLQTGERARRAPRAKPRSQAAAAPTARSSGAPARTRASKSSARPRGARSSSRQPAGRSTQAAHADPASGSARARAGTGRQRSASARAGAARPGRRHEDVLRLVAEQPGITVREIAQRLGIDPAGLYRVVKRLTDDGRVRKQGAGLHPVEPSRAPQEASASAPETAPRSDANATDATARGEPQASANSADTASPEKT